MSFEAATGVSEANPVNVVWGIGHLGLEVVLDRIVNGHRHLMVQCDVLVRTLMAGFLSQTVNHALNLVVIEARLVHGDRGEAILRSHHGKGALESLLGSWGAVVAHTVVEKFALNVLSATGVLDHEHWGFSVL